MHLLKLTAAAALCALPLAGAAHAFGPVAVPAGISGTVITVQANEQELHDWVRRLRQEKLTLQDEKSSLQARIDRLQGEVASLRRAANDNGNSRDTIDKLRVSNAALRERADTFAVQAKADRAELQDLRQRLRDRPDDTELRDQVQRLRTRADRFEAMVKERDTELAQAREAVQSRNATIDDLKARVADMRDRIERLQRRAGVR